jgi:hypothetical protein
MILSTSRANCLCSGVIVRGVAPAPGPPSDTGDPLVGAPKKEPRELKEGKEGKLLDARDLAPGAGGGSGGLGVVELVGELRKKLIIFNNGFY